MPSINSTGNSQRDSEGEDSSASAMATHRADTLLVAVEYVQEVQAGSIQ